VGRITDKGLTEKQERFCQFYATDKEFFCNGVQSYIEAFGLDRNKKGSYKVASVQAFRLLETPKILKRIDKLIELGGMNDSFVDKQLGKLIQQDADFKAKIQAIKEYNILKSRIEKKVKLTNLNEILDALKS
jgi:hypothetical protein